MRIDRLEIENLGPHERVSFDCDRANLIGIVGPNGSGKSNLLTSLMFGLHGQLPDANETYLRGYDLDNPDQKLPAGLIRLQIRHDGQVGSIERRLTRTTSSRSIQYLDEVATTDQDANALMERLLGTDLRACAEVGHVRQGELDKLLFGPQSERETLFVRMLGLGRFDKLQKLLQRKASLVLSGLEDLSSLRLEIEQQLRNSQRDLDTITIDLAGTPDVSAKLQTCRTVLQALQARDAAKQEHTKAASQLVPTPEGLDDQTIETKRRDAQQHRDKARHYSSQVSDLDQTRRGLDSLVEAMRRHQEAALELSNAGDFIALEQASQQAGTRYTGLLNRLTQQSGQNELVSRRHDLVSKSTELAETLRSTEGLIVREGVELDELKSRIEQIRSQLDQQAALREQLLTTGLEMVGAAGHECPLCCHALAPGQVHEWSEAVRASREKTRAQLEQIRTLETQAREMDNRIRDRKVLLTTLKREEVLLSASLAKLRSQHPGVDDLLHLSVQDLQDQVGVASVELRQADQALDRWRHASQAVSALGDRVAELQVGFPDLTSEEQTRQRLDDLVRTRAALNDQRDRRDQESQRLDREADRLSAALSSARASQALVARAGLDLAAKSTQYDQVRCHEAVQDIVQHLAGPGAGDYLTDLIPTLEQRVRDRSELEGRQTQSLRTVRDLEARLKDLSGREERQSKSKKLAEDLTRLANTFQRRALPLAIVQHQFELLVDLTNQALQMMESNFCVQVAPNEAVSFRFRRTDQLVTATFGQSKLSGGQRVRLTIAFLLALHELVLPQLGILILDEPSLHLDDESINQLADLLIEMAQQLGTQGRQLWVCDHSPLLQRAFDLTIRLDNVN